MVWLEVKPRSAEQTGPLIKVCSSIIQPAAVVRDLGLLMDSELSMKQHVNKVAAICYCHLRRLRQIRRRVGSEVTIRLVLALIISRIDYCNSALAGRAAVDDHPNAVSAERSGSPGVRTRTKGACYSMPSAAALASSLLADPVQAVLYHALDLSWQLAGVPDEYRSFCRCQPIPFRSALSTDYALPRLRTKFGKRAFSHAGPSAWNALPEDIRATSDSVV